jgi:peptide chain release factor 2
MRRLNLLRDEVALWDRLAGQVAEALEFLDLAEADEEEDDQALIEEAAREVDKLEEELEKLEFHLLLSGEYDYRDAILAIHAGAGGTESQDWVAMLLRMYLRWAEQHDYETQILDSLSGEGAGLKNVTVEIKGPYAYGRLWAERGVHRLVRISPFDASRRRHTSFALVEVMPELEDDIEIVINPEDLRIDVFRASGAGGQHVQKNATAVRITHLPTDIVVSCQNERSQVQNREMATKVLRSRLLDLELAKREAEHARLKGEHVEAGWGNQIRSYVLHPYHMVKDHRTGHETGNTAAVLDGELLEGFIEAYLRERLGAH